MELNGRKKISVRARSNRRCFRQNFWGLNELVFSSKRFMRNLLFMRPAELIYPLNVCTLLAALTELPQSSCEWEMSGGHL